MPPALFMRPLLLFSSFVDCGSQPINSSCFESLI